MATNEGSLADTVRQMASGFARAQELYTAVKLGIPDELADGPKKAPALASAVKADPNALYRFLRVLVARNLLFQAEDGGFGLTPMGDLLRSDHHSLIRKIILYTFELYYPLSMLYSVRTGRPSFADVFGMPVFDYHVEHPDLGALFDETRSRDLEERAAAVAGAYDFSGVETVVDVGGGRGILIGAILRACPRTRGVLFDLPAVAAETGRYFAGNGIGGRCETVGGDFLHGQVTPAADLYLLANIVHDWNDDDALRILRNCREAMRDDSRLLLIEQIMPDRVSDAPAVVGSDMSMLMLFGGAERTEGAYRSLLKNAALGVTAIVPFEPAHVLPGRKTNWAIVETRPIVG